MHIEEPHIGTQLRFINRAPYGLENRITNDIVVGTNGSSPHHCYLEKIIGGVAKYTTCQSPLIR